ncbi:MAG: HAMP domain-containing histidine kinase [Candidatus Delongbacteria bacterium]|nr:HAMP domain-containing histidine kinase [Candidatus Delongbacteria bacterium]MBN2835341.1 HAMP domain-containing histidine kinase [Candidatus Delongbacteria bacterium]
MKIKNKLLIYIISIQIFTVFMFIFLTVDYIDKSFEFTKLTNFKRVMDNEIILFAKAEESLTQPEKDEFRNSYRDLLQEYAQKETLGEDVINKLVVKVVVTLVIVLVISMSMLFFFASDIVKPIQKLIKTMKFAKKGRIEIVEEKDLKFSEVQLLYDTYKELMTEIDEYQKKIAEKSEIDGWVTMSRAIVHELNNFLMPVGNYISRIENRIDEISFRDENICENFDNLKRAYSQSKAIISSLRSFYKSGSSEKEDTNIYEELKFLCDGFNIEFSSCSYCRDTNISLSKLELNHVMVNLIKNAKDAVEDILNKQIKIELQKNHDNMIISIKDNGLGIDEDKIPLIFNPGYSNKKNGLGFGLSLVKKICTENNWQISIESIKDFGTTFKLKIKI